ncbi:MAG: hypothetical protein JWO69_1961 [Thermoleophilia bacterium]|nr:hypothetical protein [Thermoleophilia bacterium]
MSESQIYHPVLETQYQDLEVENSTRIFNALRDRGARNAAGAALSLLALTGCSSDGRSEAEANSTPSPEATQSFDVSKECGTAERNDKIASPEAILPKLSTTETKDGKTQDVLLATDKAEEVTKAFIAKNPEVLAILYTHAVETDDNLQLPDAGTLPRAKELAAKMKTDPKLLAEVLKKTCSTLSLLVADEQFGVTRGQAMLVKGEYAPDANTYSTQPVTTTGNLRGFRFNYVKDDSELSEEKRANREKLSEAMLLTEDGQLALNYLYGPNSIRIDQDQKTSVTIKLENGQLVVVKPNQTKGEVVTGSKDDDSESTNTGKTGGTTGTNGGNNPTGTNGGSNPTGTNGGTETGETGCGTPGNPECGGGTGTDTGNEGPAGDGDGPSGDGPGTGGEGPGDGGNTPPQEPQEPPREPEQPPSEPEQPPQEPEQPPTGGETPPPPPPQEEETPPPADKPDPTENCNEYDPC